MSSYIQRREHTAQPPPLEEEYWSALLNEGEYSVGGQNGHDPEAHKEFMLNVAGQEMRASSHEPSDASFGEEWTEIQGIMTRDEAIELSVIGYNRGGLLVEWKHLHGFVPASQLTEFPVTSNSIIRRNALMNLVGHKLRLRVIELNMDHNRLILSERAAQVQAGERADILHRLSRGDVVQGTITNLTDFGAFVDLGGLEGLIHISELSWGRVGHPADLLERAQLVEVYVLDIDVGAGRVALSMKRLRPDPWATVTQRYEIGQMVEGKITNVVDFGAFACIEEGLEGLIHVSELAEGHFLHPRNVVTEGQTITARVLSIDSHARRLGLTLRTNQ
jgi:small subunit ribosomal protein S1